MIYGYQEQGIAFLRSRKQALLFDEPGLGKSCQALLALPEGCFAIVVCPASVKSVWKREIEKWRPDLSPCILSGRGSFRLPKQNEVIILNYDILPDVPNVGFMKCRINLILDEIHACKSTSTLRAKKIKRIRNYVLGNNGTIHGLTGTPLLSRPDDTWGIFSALGIEKEAFGSFNNFLRVFNGRRINFGLRFSKIVWGTPTSESVDCIRGFSLGRKRTQVLPDLPTKQYEAYKVFVPRAREWGELKTFEEAENVARVLAIWRTELDRDKALASIDYLKTLAETEPLVVFTTHVQSSNEIAKAFNTTAITGEVSAPERTKIVDEFMQGKTDVIVGTIFAMGVGLTLTRSHHVIFTSRDWTPALNSQAEDRVCRIGQKDNVLVTDILADHPVEEMVYSTLLRKQEIINDSIERARESA